MEPDDKDIKELKDLLQQLVDGQNKLLESTNNKKSNGGNKKDFWDKFATVSAFLSSVIIALVGLFFTQLYNERQSERDQAEKEQQLRANKLETMEKFIPHIISKSQEEKQVAIITLNNLGDPQLTAQLAQLYPSQGVIVGLAKVAKSGSNNSKKITQDALDKISTLGIDIFSGTGLVDWQAVRNGGVLFAFMRATEGLSLVDTSFSTNWLQTKKVGIIRGAYHFFRPAQDPVKQANHFLQTVKLEAGDLPPVLDMESTPNSNEWNKFDLKTRIAHVKQWLDTVEQKTGRRPIIYTGNSFWNNTMGNSHAFTSYPLWIANYGVSEPTVPADNWGGNGWTLWQTTDSSSVNGVSNDIDRNRFKGSLDELKKFASSSDLASKTH